MSHSWRYISLTISAFVLGFFATGFGWLIYLIVFDQLPRRAEVFIQEPYEPADVVIDFDSAVGIVPKAWGGLAQGGEEAGVNMLAKTDPVLKQLQPRYIRLDHVFDDDYYGVVSRRDGKLSLNWTRLDAAVDSILSSGALPFFSLGYMPSSLASTKIDAPGSWGDWQWLVGKTIDHYSKEKGLENVYYEVWNEPDLEIFGSWKYYGGKSYLTMYDSAARAALAARQDPTVKPFKFGGPAITALYENWVRALVNHANAEGLPLDFISWHRYSYQPAQFLKDIEDVESWLGTDRYEWVISEWGPDSYKTTAYAGPLAAAHAVAVMRKTLGRLDWGFAFEVKDGPGQGNFGWGILNHTSLKPKPRYYALAYLKDMNLGSRLLISGEGSAVTGWAVGDKSKASAIFANYTPLGGQSEPLPVRFVNVPPGQYRLQWESLLGLQGEEVIDISKPRMPIEKAFTLEPNDVIKLRLSTVKAFAADPRLEKVGNTGFGRIILKEVGGGSPPAATASAEAL